MPNATIIEHTVTIQVSVSRWSTDVPQWKVEAPVSISGTDAMNIVEKHLNGELVRCMRNYSHATSATTYGTGDGTTWVVTVE